MQGTVHGVGVSAAEIAAVSAVANQALEKATEALTSGGSGNVIKITFGAEFVGAEYTVTNGSDETKTGTVPANRVVNVNVTNCNTTYTITSTADGIEYSNTVTTGAYYGQFTAVLNVFTATINVTTAPGASVTATGGGQTYTATAGSNGLAVITVKKAASYTVSAAKNGKSSNNQTVNATAEGGTYTATCKLNITTVPSQAGTATYTGSEQTVSLNNYDPDELTLGGTFKATESGTKVATVTPNSGFQWSDGTTTAKNVSWVIGKKAGNSSISPTTMALNGTVRSSSITVTRDGDGAITAQSSNTAVATVSVSGNTVNVQGIGDGTATITVKVGEGTNHLAPTDKTCSVTATNMGPKASTTQTSGVTYTNGISSLTPEKLSEIAEAISDNAAITNATSVVYVDDGANHYKISVGDSITVNFGSEARTTKIMGFNHYALTTATAYGKATATGKAGILFQTEDCLNTMQQMNSTNTNSGGWKGAALRTTLQGTIKNTLTSAWQGAIKSVKRTVGKGGGQNATEQVDDTLFLPTELEVFGTKSYCADGEGTQWAWYKAGNTKVKKVNGSASGWWECSPHASNTYWFCRVNNIGNADYSNANNSFGVAPGFCV